MEKVKRSICLTIPERKNQFSKIEKVHAALKLELIKFNGIQAATVKSTAQNSYRELVSPALKFDSTKRARLAIALSHLSIWKKIQSHMEGYSLILEDDVIVTASTIDKINLLLSQIDFSWDILFLGHSGKLKGTKKGNFVFAQSGNFPNTNHGMFAYIINPASLEKLINSIAPLNRCQHIDWLLREKYGKSIIAVYHSPSIILHDDSLKSVRKKIDRI